jgi:hypothetical protein
MAQAVLRIEGLPEGALDAAVDFHAVWLPKARALLDPPRDGEGEHAQHGGGGSPHAPPREQESPLRQPSGLPPARLGEEDLVLVFPPADYTHHGWRVAAVQDLARAAAPTRVNAIAGEDERAIADTLAWLTQAPGITGQLLAVG